MLLYYWQWRHLLFQSLISRQKNLILVTTFFIQHLTSLYALSLAVFREPKIPFFLQHLQHLIKCYCSVLVSSQSTMEKWCWWCEWRRSGHTTSKYVTLACGVFWVKGIFLNKRCKKGTQSPIFFILKAEDETLRWELPSQWQEERNTIREALESGRIRIRRPC